jgi:tight adherence protein C
MNLFLISTSLTVFFATVLVGLTAVEQSKRVTSTRLLSRVTSMRVMQIAAGRVDPRAVKQSRIDSLRSALFRAIRWGRSQLGMSDDEKLIARFFRAGLKGDTPRDAYFAARFVLPVCAIVLCFFLAANPFGWMAVTGGILYLAPDIILTRLVKRRIEKIRRGVPDAIDLLVICVDAGLGLDQAMLRVAQELGSSHPQIFEEFMQINREQRAGKLRLDAWKAMAERCKLSEIDGFVDMLLQTERFGTPIARALSNYGDTIRQKRRQRAEELAAKTTVKIIFPLVLCIFPSIFIVLLGPAGITLSRGLSLSTQ